MVSASSAGLSRSSLRASRTVTSRSSGGGPAFHLPIDAQDREVVAELQSMLVELIDLALTGACTPETWRGRAPEAS
jgi:hypothetical protein